MRDAELQKFQYFLQVVEQLQNNSWCLDQLTTAWSNYGLNLLSFFLERKDIRQSLFGSGQSKNKIVLLIS